MGALGYVAPPEVVMNEGLKTVNERIAEHLSLLEPPAPSSLVCPCRKAVEALRRGNGEQVVPLPPALLEWCDLREPVTAAELVSVLHLDAFLVR